MSRRHFYFSPLLYLARHWLGFFAHMGTAAGEQVVDGDWHGSEGFNGYAAFARKVSTWP